MVAFKDGSMAVFDREKDDQPVSLQSAQRTSRFHVTRAPKGSKHNPTSYWQVSPRAVSAFAISPDCQHVAIVSMDGCLRIVDLIDEKLMDAYESYFGGLTCVAWSPDGKYVLTGGQDDLVSVWSFVERRIIARCQGHQSWVTSVSFDDWRCDEDMYRFGSVGEDGHLLLWDFSVQALSRPKVPRDNTSITKRASSVNVSNMAEPQTHPALPRNHVPILQPIMVMTVHDEPLSSITFQEKYLMTTCCRGRIKLWERPSSGHDR
ncbi:WD40-repeat-containing domain protein [Thamnocephalis sphaerospora]|uniref:WD40-repeat-containing domain protein n=1 Tax=Thamnocephalis sphaerospora TaxID=78915 RepID=A0A4P9XJ79_9FUNG|nr:WD40-repeat-containing domain protein [Thamnocephalis sphaerospora]|eukprot:RKP05411.1 WD40-repeat-containing domain protein [Thamnocephalis sphaerospora]